NPKPEKSVKVYARALRISRRSSVTVCRAISGKPLDKGRELLAGLLTKKQSLDGKYYTNVAKELSNLINSAASNAEFKGLDPARLFIHASAHKGFTFRRPRRFKLRGEARKVANIQIVLEEK
ncbi:MAG: uL22 family ribosomal protein, partial [Candidatus Aenigmatarchaeota archaeon]